VAWRKAITLGLIGVSERSKQMWGLSDEQNERWHTIIYRRPREWLNYDHSSVVKREESAQVMPFVMHQRSQGAPVDAPYKFISADVFWENSERNDGSPLVSDGSPPLMELEEESAAPAADTATQPSVASDEERPIETESQVPLDESVHVFKESGEVVIVQRMFDRLTTLETAEWQPGYYE
jgi:hypothetical protein